LEAAAPDKAFSKTVFFRNILKTVSDIEKMYQSKFVGLSIYNNLLLAWHILILNRF